MIDKQLSLHHPLNLDAPPTSWTVVFLNQIALAVQPGFASGKHNLEGTGIPHLRPMNIDREGKIDLAVVKSVVVKNDIQLENGDILFNNTNSAELIGKTALISSREHGFSFSNHMTKICLEDHLSKLFLAKQIHFLWMSGYFKYRCTHHVNQASISSKILADTVPLLLPPTREQTRVVEKLEELLSDLDAGVAELKAAQKKLTQYRQSLLKAAVEGRLTAEWRAERAKRGEPLETGAQLLERILAERRRRWEEKQLAKFKEQGKTPPKDWRDKYPEPVKPNTAGLPELPEGWFYCDLEPLIPPDKTGTKTGPFGSLLKKHEHKNRGVPVIEIENIDQMKFMRGSKIHISLEKAAELNEYKLLPKDIVISRSGTVGEVCVIPDDLGEARFSTNIMRVRLESQIIRPNYFCLLLNGSPYVLNQIRELCSGSTRDFLNTEILKSLVFSVPPINEQDKTLLVLSVALAEVENQAAAIELSLKQSSAQRQNILKAAFSGQLVPQDPNDEPASVLLERIRAERAARESGGRRRGRKAKEDAA